MEYDLSFLYHHSSKDKMKGHPPIPDDPALWPDEWKTIYYKAYHRLPKVLLPEERGDAISIFQLIEERESRRGYTGIPIALSEIATVLKYSCGNIKPFPNGAGMARAHPSGGARFPLETYLFVFQASPSLPSGVYHYNVKQHTLDVLEERGFARNEISRIVRQQWAQKAQVLFVLTAIFQRNRVKYGERGYRYILLEAGHIGQNVYLVSEALKLRCCAIGGTNDREIEKLLDIDGVSESVIYGIALGK